MTYTLHMFAIVFLNETGTTIDNVIMKPRMGSKEPRLVILRPAFEIEVERLR